MGKIIGIDLGTSNSAAAAMIGGKPSSDGSEQWKRIGCQGEQQPAQIYEADKSENYADGNHGGGSPCKIDGRASTTTAHC